MISTYDLGQLIQALKDESMDSEGRRNATEAIGKIKDPKAVDTLIQYFKDPAQYIPNPRSLVQTFDELLRSRSAAEEALVKIGEPAIPSLIQVLEDDDYRLSDAARALNDNVSFIRRSAVRALGRINDAQVIGPLIQAFRDNDSGVQSEAEDQLRKNIFDKSRDSSLEDSLIQALKDDDSDVRMKAEEFLGRFLAQSTLQKEQSQKIQLQFW